MTKIDVLVDKKQDRDFILSAGTPIAFINRSDPDDQDMLGEVTINASFFHEKESIYIQ